MQEEAPGAVTDIARPQSCDDTLRTEPVSIRNGIQLRLWRRDNGTHCTGHAGPRSSWFLIACSTCMQGIGHCKRSNLEQGATAYVCMYVCTCMYVYMYVCMYVCMCVCTYMYVCTCMYVCMYVCMCVCMYVRMYMYVHVCMYLHVCMCVCTYMYVCTCMYVCTYVCMYMYVCMYICMYVCMCVCMYVHVCMYVRMCVCTCMYVCIYVCMYVCMYMYVHVCMHVHVCMYMRVHVHVCVEKGNVVYSGFIHCTSTHGLDTRLHTRWLVPGWEMRYVPCSSMCGFLCHIRHTIAEETHGQHCDTAGRTCGEGGGME